MNFASIESSLAFALGAVWRASWQASIIAAIVLVLQFAVQKRIGGRGRYVLWSIVLVRLLLPVAPESRWSLFNLRYDLRETKAADVTEGGHQPLPVRLSYSEVRAITFPAVSDAPRPFIWRWDLIAAGIWVLGGVVLSIRILWACLGIRKLTRALTPVQDVRIHQIIQACAELLRLRTEPEVLSGNAVSTPVLVGVLRPALLLPAKVIEQCDSNEFRLIVMHELAHLKRRDVAANWLLALATTLHWFNPFVWFIAARIRADRELACDEMVLSYSAPNEAQAYGRTLLKLIEILSPASPPRSQAVGILESSRPMQRRVRMIARFNPQSSSRWIWVTLLLLAVLGCGTLTDSVKGQTKPSSPPVVRSVRAPSLAQPAIDGSDRPVETEASVQARLRKVLPEIRFDAIPLSEVMEFLRDVSNANLVVNWRALETSGIDKKSPVTLRLRDVSFEQALNQILRDVGGGTVRLDYAIDGGLIVVSTSEDLGGMSQTVFYDVSDMMFSLDGRQLSATEVSARMASLANVITETVAPESWSSSGGSGKLSIFDAKLIVATTPKIHQQVKEMLINLREKPTTRPQAASAS